MNENMPVVKKKKMSRSASIIWLFIGFILYMIFSPEVPKTPPSVAPKTAEELASSKREDLTLKLYVTVRQAMREPDSIQVDSLRSNDEATIACIAYRGRNGFGGMTKEVAVAKGKNVYTTVSAWNKNCTGLMVDMSWSVRNAEVIYRMYTR